jgi:hypothetical protein
MRFFNVAGGARYHLRAMRYSGRFWAPFRSDIGRWLNDWNPGGKKLVIVGASGGYCVNQAWLHRFDEIVCLDPDPLARAIFTRRVRSGTSRAPGIQWDFDNFLDEPTPQGQLDRFAGFLSKHPGAPVLFSNFLGQLNLLLEESTSGSVLTLAHWKRSLVSEILEQRPWASFHDRVSGRLAPACPSPLRSAHRLADREIIERFYSAESGMHELGDHDTEGFFDPALTHTYFRWDLTPHWHHLIEAVYNQSL